MKVFIRWEYYFLCFIEDGMRHPDLGPDFYADLNFLDSSSRGSEG